MKIYDIIAKKRDGRVVSREEYDFFINGYVSGEIPDYQASAFLMAAYIRGMDKQEMLDFTLAMAESSQAIVLSDIDGIKVDKHSTGGVGDKTTLVIVPLVASCGVPVAKLSGRGLGHTGGTIDKLESIKGFNVNIGFNEFIQNVNDISACIAGGSIVLADKKIYALRDVTATVDSIPLIAASIMSKKLCSGSDALLLDVKAGNGAFMKNLENAFKLAESMVSIGKGAGLETTAVITDMSQPLGRNIGNSLEVMEAIEILKGRGDKRLRELCLFLGCHLLVLGGKADNMEDAANILNDKINSGEAVEKFRGLIGRQGGDPEVVDNYDLLPLSDGFKVLGNETGYISEIDCEGIGQTAMHAGAGRVVKEDSVDHGAGIILNKKIGDFIEKGETLAVIHTKRTNHDELKNNLLKCFKLTDEKPEEPRLIIDTVYSKS